MKASLIAALSLLLLTGCALTHERYRSENVFSELQPGDRIHVFFGSVGCFHNVAYSLDFERDSAPRVRVASLGRAWSPISPDFDDQDPKPLGTLILTARDLRALDNLMRFYRGHPDGFCTTHDAITVKYPRYLQGRREPIIVTEHFDDLSGDTYRTRGLMTFPALAQRLERGGR